MQISAIFFLHSLLINLNGVCEFPPIILHFFFWVYSIVFLFSWSFVIFLKFKIFWWFFFCSKICNRLLKLFHGTFEIMRNFIEKVSTLTIFHHWYNRFYERFDLTHNQWIVTNFVQHLASFMTWTLTRLCSSNQER